MEKISLLIHDPKTSTIRTQLASVANPTSEAAIACIVMIDAPQYVMADISHEDFSVPQLASFWWAVGKLVADGVESPTDPQTIVAKLDSIDGVSRLNYDAADELAEYYRDIVSKGSASLNDIDTHVANVKEAATRIRAAVSNFYATRDLLDKSKPLRDTVSRAVGGLLAINSDSSQQDQSLGAKAARYVERLQSGAKLFVPSGWKSIDDARMFGWRQNVSVLASGTGNGKTTFASYYANSQVQVAEDDEFVGYFALEQQDDIDMSVRLEIVSGVPIDRQSASNITKDELKKLIAAVELIKAARSGAGVPLHVWTYTDTPPNSADGIFLELQRTAMRTKKKPRCVVVDGIWNMCTNAGESGILQYSTIYLELQRIAIRLNIPIVLVAQITGDRSQKTSKSKAEPYTMGVKDIEGNNVWNKDISQLVMMQNWDYYGQWLRAKGQGYADVNGVRVLTMPKNRNGGGVIMRAEDAPKVIFSPSAGGYSDYIPSNYREMDVEF